MDIIEAAKNADLEAVTNLISTSIDIDVKDDSGSTALRYAASNNHLEIAEILLKNGAMVNCRRNDGTCCLHVAATAGYLSMVKLLLRYGADIDIKVGLNMSPIVFAIINSKVEMIELLLSHDVEFKLNAYENRRFRHLVTHYTHNKRIMKLLMAHEKFKAVGEWRPWLHEKYPLSYRKTMSTLLMLAKS